MKQSNFKSRGDRRRQGFTLAELLVTLAIIGLLAGLVLPSMVGFGKSNAMISASRQLLDDAAFARQQAISTRSTVYMVFVSPDVATPAFATALNAGTAYSEAERRLATNLFRGQFVSYALFSRHNVGDQPGRGSVRYLTSWKTLPDGVFVGTNKYRFLADLSWRAASNAVSRPFAFETFPFPTDHSPVFADPGLPFIAFNAQGQLISEMNSAGNFEDAYLPVAHGSILNPTIVDSSDKVLPAPGRADVQETPPGESTDVNTWTVIHINWLTGRGKIERPEVR